VQVIFILYTSINIPYYVQSNPKTKETNSRYALLHALQQTTAQSIEALRYKPEGRGIFYCHNHFGCTMALG